MIKISKLRIAIYTCFITLIILIFFFWGPPKFYQESSTSEYCNSCHVLNYQYEAWFMTGLHRSIKCVDCHITNSSPVSHFIWKGIDGLKDLLSFHLNIFSEPLEITSHGKEVIQENCLRCHDGMVSVMNVKDRYCWDCHRRVNHKTADIVTLEIK